VGLLAVACLETAERVPPDLRAAIIAQARSYIPPQDEEEAKQLAKAGDPIVPLLAHQPAHEPREAANCVRALAQIGTTAAMDMLVGYTACEYEGAEKRNKRVLGSLGTAWEYFDRQTYAQTVLARISSLFGPPEFPIRAPVSLTCWQDISVLTHVEELHIKLPNEVIRTTPLEKFKNIYSLGLHGTGTVDLTPLTAFTNLQLLILGALKEVDLNPLAGLANLQRLVLNGTEVRNLTPLAFISSLQDLYLIAMELKDLSPLTSLTNLQWLFLGNVAVYDITPLASIPALDTLILDETQVRDLTPLADLTNLERLDLRGIGLSDLTLLANLVSLQTLHLSGDAVSDLTPLAGLTNLQRLNLDNTAIRDLTPLMGLTNLRELHLRGTQADTAPLKHLEQLKIRR